MMDRFLTIHGEKVPRFLYGTAWKEQQTKPLAELALKLGFRGIDTANQRRHYHEAAVGEAVRDSIASGMVAREDLFLQTKFTFRQGQDHRLPYDPKATVGAQVEQSFVSSLAHLNIEQIDSYLLHGPSSSVGMTADDWAAWRSMEAIHNSGRARMLGISNVCLQQLRLLCDNAEIPPSFVQNRCFAATSWDRQIREFCTDHGIIYQAFSLLTANGKALASPQLLEIAAKYNRTVPQIVFRFAIDVGMIPLTGSTNAEHLRADLDVFDFHLQPEEIERIERCSPHRSA